MDKQKVTRKLTAILAADVVGYSRLIRADEEGTLSALKELREDMIDRSIARHEGRIVKTMGDGVLVEFPSVVDAVRSAVEIRRYGEPSRCSQGPPNRVPDGRQPRRRRHRR